MGASNSIHYDKYGIDELDDSTLSPLNKNESRLVFNSQSIYNMKIRHNKILKYTIWMNREKFK